VIEECRHAGESADSSSADDEEPRGKKPVAAEFEDFNGLLPPRTRRAQPSPSNPTWLRADFEAHHRLPGERTKCRGWHVPQGRPGRPLASDRRARCVTSRLPCQPTTENRQPTADSFSAAGAGISRPQAEWPRQSVCPTVRPMPSATPPNLPPVARTKCRIASGSGYRRSRRNETPAERSAGDRQPDTI
jgi:hypothetical protein